MQHTIDSIVLAKKTHKEAAAFLEYSERQWYNIRQKIQNGEELPRKTVIWIISKFESINRKRNTDL